MNNVCLKKGGIDKKLSKELGVSNHQGGVSGTDLNSWISKKSNFGVQRIVQPRLREATAIIRSGNGFILRYIWGVLKNKDFQIYLESRIYKLLK